MPKIYEGPEPCLGCGVPGSIKARRSKGELCYNCTVELKLGHALAIEKDLPRNHYNLDDLRVGHITWYTIYQRELEIALTDLLKEFSYIPIGFASNRAPHKENILCGHIDAVTRHDSFVLPTQLFDKAKLFCEAVKKVSDDLYNEEHEYKKRLDDELRQQKNEIYNMGVAKGRQLLFQLNAGEITEEDFNKRVIKY